MLCGGSGTRLWPLSRKSYPKQFAKITGDNSLFQQAATRLSGDDFAPPLIVTGNDFRFIVTEQLAAVEIAPRAVLIEPEGRNTAPAVLAAALVLAEQDPEALILAAPSDHVIPDDAAFRAAVLAAAPRAQTGDLITFGITPTRAESGYGYLELVEGADAIATTPQTLARFVEKPDAARAAEMLASGNFLWNAGIFLFTAQSLIAAFRAHAPDVLSPVEEAIRDAQIDLGFTRLAPSAWVGVPDISIDYAIMERASNLAVMPFGAGWSDLGGWDAVWQESGPDSDGNVISDHATAIDCVDTLLRSESERVELVGIGLSDMIAVATSDAVLVAHKSQAQRVKEAVAALKAKGASQATEFPVDHRPWGWFESLVLGKRFQVKRIHVHPGAALSLQSHHHRSEHWIVVEGTAKITIDDKVQLISENQSVYIPLGAVHRMENPGKLPLTCFKAYDIRGRLGVDLDAGIAYRIGRGFAHALDAKRILLGRDCRASSEELAQAVAQALQDEGGEVLDLGLSGTEEMYFATSHFEADGGICVTASHNPMDWNGIKMVRAGSAPLDIETGLAAIRTLAEADDLGPARSGSRRDISTEGRAAYVRRVLSFIDVTALQRLHILVNAGNGAAGPTFDAIAAELAARGAHLRFARMHHTPDGDFPNGIPNPLLPENQPATAEAVRTAGAEFGVAWVSDFDRCFLFDHEGSFIPGGHGKLGLLQGWIKARMDAKPDLTLDDLVLEIADEHQMKVHRVSVWRSLRSLGLTHKKRPASRRAKAA